jgi:hypothetical protein
MRKITKWVDVNTAEELFGALADIRATPMGDVGQHIGYRITETARREMKGWNFDDKLNVNHAVNHPYDRLDTGGTTHADVGGDYSPKPKG